MVPSDSAWVVSCSPSVDTVFVCVTIFAIFDVQFWWPWSRPVQGHPVSKHIGPIESPLMVSSLTSFESNIVSFMAFEVLVLVVKVLWPRSMTVQDYPRSKSCCQLIALGWFPIRSLLTTTSHVSPFWNIWWHWTRTVQSHSRSNLMVAIDSPCVVSYRRHFRDTWH